MANTFFMGPCDMISSYPRCSPNIRGNFARSQSSPSPKFVSVPIHFIGSERRRSDSALMIQKVFRGFLVRKSVKRILAIKNEVDEIERTILKTDMVESIRKNSKEQLKFNEALMSLLFRLDSVRGVDCGVRDFRKSVIKKAIALQETLDAIAGGGDTPGGNGEALVVSDCGGVDGDASNQTVKGIDCASDDNFPANIVDEWELQNPTASNSVEYEEKPAVEELQNHKESMVVEAADEIQIERQNVIEGLTNTKEVVIEEDEGNLEVENREEVSELSHEEIDAVCREAESQIAIDPQNLNEVAEEEYELVEEATGGEVDRKEANCAGGEENGNSEVLERIVEENKRMMGMMTQLLEKNEKQTRLLSSLSQRVGQLEKAFLTDRMRRMKKWQYAGIIDGFESCDRRKCGKR